MLNYARMLFHGDGIPVNQEKALRYYKMTIDTKDLDSIYSYAKIFYNGNDEYHVDKIEAARILKISADEWHIKSLFKLGLMLLKGDGIQIDKQNGINYLKMAVNKGNSDAKNVLKSLE